MGRTIALLLPFIIAGLLFLYWAVYKAGKRNGEKNAPQRANLEQIKLLRRANIVFNDLLRLDNIESDDLITDKTRETLNQWTNDYSKAISK